MARALAVVLLAVSCILLAGCVTPEEAPEAPAGEDAKDATPDTPTPVGTPMAAPEAPEARRSRVVAVEGTGTTSQGAWFCTEPHGTGGCQGQELTGGEYTVHLDFEDALVGASLNITWDALDATLDTMVIVYGVHTENGTERFEPFESTSPAAIDLTGGPHGTGGMVYIGLWPAAEAKTPAGAAFVDVQRQRFDVAGQLRVR